MDPSVHRITWSAYVAYITMAVSGKSYLENAVGVVLIAAQIACGYSQTPTLFSVVHGTSHTIDARREGIINDKSTLCTV